MLKLLRQLKVRINRELWTRETPKLPFWHRSAIRTTRLAVVLYKDATEGQITLRAMGLVYTTLLSFVPLLALSFSVLKGFGIHNQVQPILGHFLEPLGARGDEITGQIISFVDNVKVGVLGSAGLALLIYTVIALIYKVESGLNYVFHVQQTHNLVRRMSSYLSILLIGPVLMAAALGMTATVASNTVVHQLLSVEPLGTALVWLGKFLPYLMVIVTFMLCYVFIPSTRVKLGPAFIGALAAGIAWESVGRIFTAFVAGSGRYDAIYSGFAIVLLFMIWLYVSWLILLLGGQLVFYLQNPRFVMRRRIRTQASNRLREQLALAIMYAAGKRFRKGEQAWTTENMVSSLGVAGDTLGEVIQRLMAHGLLIQVESDESAAFVPGRDLAKIRLADILDAVRSTWAQHDHPELRLSDSSPVAAKFDELEAALHGAAREQTLADWLD